MKYVLCVWMLGTMFFMYKLSFFTLKISSRKMLNFLYWKWGRGIKEIKLLTCEWGQRWNLKPCLKFLQFPLHHNVEEGKQVASRFSSSRPAPWLPIAAPLPPTRFPWGSLSPLHLTFPLYLWVKYSESPMVCIWNESQWLCAKGLVPSLRF